MTTLTWTAVDEDHQWVVEALEKELLETNQTPAELRAEAQRVRGEVPDGDADVHKALFTYAANLELVAAEREAAQAA